MDNINYKGYIEKLEKENKRLKEKLREIGKLHGRLMELQEELNTDSDNKAKKLEEFSTRQKRIFQNKVDHGFNITNIYQEARYILEETAELMGAIEKNDRPNMLEELADIVIFAYGCAEVARLGDLDTRIFEKMQENECRKYIKNSEGDFEKVSDNLNNGGH